MRSGGEQGLRAPPPPKARERRCERRTTRCGCRCAQLASAWVPQENTVAAVVDFMKGLLMRMVALNGRGAFAWVHDAAAAVEPAHSDTAASPPRPWVARVAQGGIPVDAGPGGPLSSDGAAAAARKQRRRAALRSRRVDVAAEPGPGALEGLCGLRVPLAAPLQPASRPSTAGSVRRIRGPPSSTWSTGIETEAPVPALPAHQLLPPPACGPPPRQPHDADAVLASLRRVAPSAAGLSDTTEAAAASAAAVAAAAAGRAALRQLQEERSLHPSTAEDAADATGGVVVVTLREEASAALSHAEGEPAGGGLGAWVVRDARPATAAAAPAFPAAGVSDASMPLLEVCAAAHPASAPRSRPGTAAQTRRDMRTTALGDSGGARRQAIFDGGAAATARAGDGRGGDVGIYFTSLERPLTSARAAPGPRQRLASPPGEDGGGAPGEPLQTYDAARTSPRAHAVIRHARARARHSSRPRPRRAPRSRRPAEVVRCAYACPVWAPMRHMQTAMAGVQLRTRGARRAAALRGRCARPRGRRARWAQVRAPRGCPRARGRRGGVAGG